MWFSHQLADLFCPANMKACVYVVLILSSLDIYTRSRDETY